jgi:hypothetical protein
MQKRSKNSAKRALELHQFPHFFLPVRDGWRSCDFDAPQAGSMALPWYPRRGLKRAKNGL